MASVHPDRAGGDHELFVFLSALREHVEECLGAAKPGGAFAPANAGPREEPERIPYDPSFGNADAFVGLTCRALEIAGRVGEPYNSALSLLGDCPAHEGPYGRAVPRQSRGASYRQLAAIAHTLGWSKAQRVRWYRVAEEIPLSDAHAHHILARLPQRSAA